MLKRERFRGEIVRGLVRESDERENRGKGRPSRQEAAEAAY